LGGGTNGVGKNKNFWASTLILILTVFLMITTILRWINFGFFVGPFRLNHWFVWIGTFYIAFAVPVISVLKRRHPNRAKNLARLHMFGNLAAFLLISIHFASQISRPAEIYPDLGTGLALYIDLILLVGTGISQRSQLIPKIKPQTYRFLHTGAAVTFYLIIVIHILHGLGII
jgi:hypothetical protein